MNRSVPDKGPAARLGAEALRDLLGKGFLEGGRGPEFYDCWGLAMEIYRRLGVVLPDLGQRAAAPINGSRGRSEAIEAGRPWFVRIEEPEPWALVTLRLHPRLVTHLGVVMPGGKTFIHILKGSRVTVERLGGPPWEQRIEGYYIWKE